MKIRDRIKELRRVKASDLLPCPKNWRKHPKAQRDAMAGVLAEIGYADALLVRETPEGLMLIDGHLRAETTPDSMVPVLVLDVTEAEANKILVTLDPLAGMAEVDTTNLDALLREVNFSSEAVQKMLSDLAISGGIVPPAIGDWPAMEPTTSHSIVMRYEQEDEPIVRAFLEFSDDDSLTNGHAGKKLLERIKETTST